MILNTFEIAHMVRSENIGVEQCPHKREEMVGQLSRHSTLKKKAFEHEIYEKMFFEFILP